MSKHIHADLMLQYAQDAMTTDEPWLLWEFKTTHGSWNFLTEHPSWVEDTQYRRKPRTININGFEVPEPVREPLKDLEKYYFVCMNTVSASDNMYWDNNFADRCRLQRGIIHLTSEAAEIHAKALLSFTEEL